MNLCAFMNVSLAVYLSKVSKSIYLLYFSFSLSGSKKYAECLGYFNSRHQNACLNSPMPMVEEVIVLEPLGQL